MDCARIGSRRWLAACLFFRSLLAHCMLCMFGVEGSDESDSSTVQKTTADRAIVEQLEKMQRAQAHQAMLMASLESRISEVLSVSCSTSGSSSPGEETMLPSCSKSLQQSAPATTPPSAPQLPGEAPKRNIRRPSWTWDPQMQGNLERNFQSFRNAGRRKANQTPAFDARADRVTSVLACQQGPKPSFPSYAPQPHAECSGSRPSSVTTDASTRSATTTTEEEPSAASEFKVHVEVDTPRVTTPRPSHPPRTPLKSPFSAEGIVAKWAKLKKSKQATWADMQSSSQRVKCAALPVPKLALLTP